MTVANLTLVDRIKPPIEQWKLALRQLGRDIRVAVPGIIQSFNPVAQTAVVQVAITEKMNIWSAGQNGALQQTQQEKQIPLLGDVPVLLPRSAGFAITLPIQPGDECLLIFNDCMIDWFWQSGSVASTNNNPRRHDLSDAVCIPTGISQAKVLTSYSGDSLQVRSIDGATVIDVKDGTVTVTAATVNVAATTATVMASGTATVEGNQVNITGTSKVTIAGDSMTTIESRVFLAHTHSGVSSGGSISGPVV